jgi:hypothetical protein
MVARVSVLTLTRTREHAEWAAESLRRHAAFSCGEIWVEPPPKTSATDTEGDGDRFQVLYRGPIRHETVQCDFEPLDLDADDFDDRAAAERACAAARREIAPGDISDVHVENAGDSMCWYLLWLHASVIVRGQPRPRQPRRPGS